MTPEPITKPYDSCHHAETTKGDSFGGLGTDRECCEEDLFNQPRGIIVLPALFNQPRGIIVLPAHDV